MRPTGGRPGLTGILDDQAVIAHTRRWLAEIVIGLNLCPFARRVFEGGRIRYVVSAARGEDALASDLRNELQALAATALEDVETTLLIHPWACPDFSCYNEFLTSAEDVLAELGLVGTIQIASFHPDYRFAGARVDAVENYTNRSPYPMLHLLREASVALVAGAPHEIQDIPRRNIATLTNLGTKKIQAMLTALAEGVQKGSDNP
jgi:hypothetical protein